MESYHSAKATSALRIVHKLDARVPSLDRDLRSLVLLALDEVTRTNAGPTFPTFGAWLRGARVVGRYGLIEIAIVERGDRRADVRRGDVIAVFGTRQVYLGYVDARGRFVDRALAEFALAPRPEAA